MSNSRLPSDLPAASRSAASAAPASSPSGSSGPTFVGVGGQKCASTWLAECLAAHPEVFVHPKKEIKYFNLLTQEGQANEDTNLPLDWYLDHFAGSDCVSRGEFTPDYLFEPTAAERMRNDLGPIRILCVFRDPVARLKSHLRHCVRRGLLHVDLSRPLGVVELEGLVQAYPGLVQNGFYFDALQPFLDAFGPEHVCVSIYEQMTAQPHAEVARVFEFLGVDATFEPPMLEKVVGGGFVPKSRLAENSRIAVFKTLHRFAPALLPMIRATGVTTMYRKLNAKPLATRLTPDAEQLLRDLYADTAAGLESLGLLTPGLWSCSTASLPTASIAA